MCVAGDHGVVECWDDGAWAIFVLFEVALDAAEEAAGQFTRILPFNLHV